MATVIVISWAAAACGGGAEVGISDARTNVAPVSVAASLCPLISIGEVVGLYPELSGASVSKAEGGARFTCGFALGDGLTNRVSVTGGETGNRDAAAFDYDTFVDAEPDFLGSLDVAGRDVKVVATTAGQKLIFEGPDGLVWEVDAVAGGAVERELEIESALVEFLLR